MVYYDCRNERQRSRRHQGFDLLPSDIVGVFLANLHAPALRGIVERTVSHPPVLSDISLS